MYGISNEFLKKLPGTGTRYLFFLYCICTLRVRNILSVFIYGFYTVHKRIKRFSTNYSQLM